MDIRLARIDNRLIHGRVAVVWSKQTDVERIIVTSDVVARDELKKFLLKEVAPPGITVNVITVQKMIQAYHSGLLSRVKVMLLFTNPQGVEAVVHCGVQLKPLSISGMSFTEGKSVITNLASVSRQDIDSFRYLNSQEMELEIRKIPADRRILLMELLVRIKKVQQEWLLEKAKQFCCNGQQLLISLNLLQQG